MQVINFSRPKKWTPCLRIKQTPESHHFFLKDNISHAISNSLIKLTKMKEIVHKAAMIESDDPEESEETKKATKTLPENQ